MNNELENIILNYPSISSNIKFILIEEIKRNNNTVIALVELERHFQDVLKVLKDKGIIEGL